MQKSLFKSLFENFNRGGFRVEYWDGEEEIYGCEEPRVKIIMNRPPSSGLNLADPVMAFSEAYMNEDLDFEGSMDDILRVLELNKDSINNDNIENKMMSALKVLNSAKDKMCQKENVQQHYDLGNDFFLSG